MQRPFYAIEEPEPGETWQAVYRRLEQGYHGWFLAEGDAARPPYLTSVKALNRHMPELVPTYERLVELAGGSDRAARLLSLYRPTPYLTGCSQAVWTREEPLLVRNYDYSPRLWDGVLLKSAWQTPVIGMLDSLWGVLDGINDDGLAVALAFGGRKVVGDGFGMPLILRYVLETCRTTREAAKTLQRVPSHMAYNVTVVDREGEYVTVFAGPDRKTQVVRRRVATNHQHAVEWTKFASATASVDRERFLTARLEDAEETASRFVDRFLEPPLYSTRFDHGWGTLYTVIYRPRTGAATYRWPTLVLPQSLTDFRPAVVALTYQAA